MLSTSHLVTLSSTLAYIYVPPVHVQPSLLLRASLSLNSCPMADASPRYDPSYAAFFAPRTHAFETVDFHVPASLVNLKTYFATTDIQRVRHQRIAALVAFIVGVLIAIIAFIVDQLTRGLTLAVYRLTDTLFRANHFWPAVVVFTAISLLYVIIPALMVVYIAPLGAGSGIPELKSYLNGVRVPAFLAAHSLFVKAVGVAFSIASGLICGKQGPMIHAGAIVGAGVSQGASSRLSFRFQRSMFTFLRTEAWKRDFSAVGAGVGVAAAFGSPMGAWMWVFEEACTHWTWRIGILTLAGCLTGAIVVRILNFLAAGIPGLGFGTFTLTQFGKLVTPFDGSSFPLKDFPAYALIGIIGGVVGALLPLLNKYITLFRYDHVKKPKRRLLETAIIGILTSLIRIIVPYLAKDCRDINLDVRDALQDAPLQDFSSFVCPPSQFSPWAALIYNPSDSVVRALLYAPNTAFPAGAVAVAFVFYFLFIVWTYGIAVPAGVFFPGFLLGSVFGRLIGIAVNAIFPSRTDISLTGYAFLGAVAALAGFTRTVSVAVIALEATGLTNASFGAAFVALVAKVVGDFLYDRGIYDLHIDLKGIPFLSSQVPHVEKYYNVRLADVMSTNVIGVRRYSRVRGLLSTLLAYDHNAFPVFVKIRSGASNSGAGAIEIQEHLVSADKSEAESASSSLRLEAEEEDDAGVSIPSTRYTSSSLITPSHFGLQAHVFDEGEMRLITLSGPKDMSRSTTERQGASMKRRSRPSNRSTAPSNDENGKELSQESSAISSGRSRGERVRFELVGIIDRGTLLALLKHEYDKQSRRNEGENVDDGEPVPWENLDSAWPNRARLKGDWEKEFLEQLDGAGLDGRLIDLTPYVDPNPGLMADRALSIAAYERLRQMGSRHILVVNTRLGEVVGIVTRKDILPDSVAEIYEGYGGVKVA